MRRLSAMIFAVPFWLLASCSAANDNEPPALELSGRVVDAAEILDPNAERGLSDKLSLLETDTGVQMVVVTAPTLEGQAIKDFSLQLANRWGVGSAERDDGLIVLVAPNERKVRIEVGLGLESVVTNEEAQEIIDAHILPAFRSGDFPTGIENAVDKLSEEVSQAGLEKAA